MITDELYQNPFNLNIGDMVTADYGFRNSCTVEIMEIYSESIFCRVKGPDSLQWDIMTNRLTPIKK